MQQADENAVLKKLVEERKEFYLRKYCKSFEPEYDHYTIKTRPPHYVYNFQLNYFRRSREEELRDEAMRAARLKCHQSANDFTKCSVANPFNEPTMCKDVYQKMKLCFRQEFEVEMDKRRRDMDRHPEWWWRNIYDEDGEVGEQAKDPPYTYVEKVGDAVEWLMNKMDGVFYRHDK